MASSVVWKETGVLSRQSVVVGGHVATGAECELLTWL